jgi:hypothetical protein
MNDDPTTILNIAVVVLSNMLGFTLFVTGIVVAVITIVRALRS